MIPSDLIERASLVCIEDEIERRGIKLVGGIDRCGPCPRCGGHDRFSLNTRKQVFFCRGCDARGNVIDLVRLIEGCDFREAVERLTGDRASPGPQPAPQVPDSRRLPCDDVRLTGDRAIMFAKQIAFELRPILGSPDGETYLRVARKIVTSAIENVLERTDAIGWHRAVYFNEPGHALHGRKLGCIIGVMTDPVTGEPTGAISRTYHPRRTQARQGEDARFSCRDYQAVGRRRRARTPAYRRGPRNRARGHVDRP